MIEIINRRNTVPRVRRRVNHDSLRLPKLSLAALAIFSFSLSAALLLQAGAELRAITGLAWSIGYIAAMIGLDERRSWGQGLAVTMLVGQPVALAALANPFWQLGAVVGLVTLPLAIYLCQGKITRLLG